MKKLKELIRENPKIFVWAIIFSILNSLCFGAMFWLDLWIVPLEGASALRVLFIYLMMFFSVAFFVFFVSLWDYFFLHFPKNDEEKSHKRLIKEINKKAKR